MPWLLLLIPAAVLAWFTRKPTTASGDIRIARPDAHHLPDDWEYDDVSRGASGSWAVTPTSGATGSWTPPRKAQPYMDAFNRATALYRLPVGLLARIAQQESGFNPAIVNKKSGAAGLMQFMPHIAARLGFDPFVPALAIDNAGKELQRTYRRWGSWRMALASYNWGEGNLSRLGVMAAPAETVNYVLAIAGDLGL